MWKQIKCCDCDGSGLSLDYGLGLDFYGPKECITCCGSGKLSISSNDRLAKYPGGPLLGNYPGLYKRS